jgi:hypothetical protein
MLLAVGASSAATFTDGLLFWDVPFPGNAGQFDIANESGPNHSAFPDTTFPIVTLLSLSNLSLTVHFANGSTTVFGSSYFTLAADGESFNGSPIAIGGTNPLPTSATLTGTFSPLTITLNSGGSPQSIQAAFSTTVNPSSGRTLADGDFGIIEATTAVTGVPEPGTWLLTGFGVAVAGVIRRKKDRNAIKQQIAAHAGLFGKVLLVGCLLVTPAMFAQHLNTFTSPDNGVAGVDTANVVGSGFPSGQITFTNVLVTFSTSCGGAASATTSANSVQTLIGSARRINFSIPGSLATATYFVAVSDSGAGGDVAFDTRGTSCSQLSVTHTNPTLSACLPTSSLAVLSPTNPGVVTAYVPNANWGAITTGVQAVQLEGGSSKTSIGTVSPVNSCSSNPATGQTVCTANNTDVYLITGTTLNTTLHSNSNALASFSGGSCNNCGVAINALSNKAVINMGLTPSPTNSGVQLLDLNTNTFSPPVPQTNGVVSEDISVDPTRSLILSPSEGGNYSLFQIQSDGTTLKEFGSAVGTGLEADSAAEDCSTGIALTVGEFTNSVYLADLSQAVFGSPIATQYTAPHTTVNLVTNYSFSAGLSAVAVAPGSSHLAVATGEFGGNTFAVLQLPATGGSGTPTILDYAVAVVPSSTTCGTWSSGNDPHTTTAYTSPNDGKAYAVFANTAPASCLVRLDLAAILAAPRGGAGLGAHDVSTANFPAGAATFFLTH